MLNFREVLESCNLHDQVYVGDCFTWSNIHEANTYTKERLDRAVVNPN